MSSATSYDPASCFRVALRLPKKQTVSEWADENRYLDSKTSNEPGRWRTSRTPYLREMMDAFSDAFTEQITVMKPTQVGATEAMFNMVGYAVDNDPGPGMICREGEKLAKATSMRRLQPMFRLSPSLSKHIPLNEDDFTWAEYDLDTMLLSWAWAGSPAQLASFARRYVWLDEVDKYPPFSGKEADPVMLAIERTRTFIANRKIVLASTPTTEQGYINREYQASDKSKYHVPCPHCHGPQVFIFDQIKFPEGERDPSRIRDDRLAWYECIHCHETIGDRHKQWMLECGAWVPEGVDCEFDETDGRVIVGPHKPSRHRGFWLNAIYSPWLTFSEIAAKFLESKDNIATLMNFHNSWLAQVWHDKAEEITAADFEEKEIRFPRLEIPEGAYVLTAGVDVQKRYLYYVLRAWGLNEESWLVDCNTIGDLGRVEDVLYKGSWKKRDGTELQMAFGCIDAGYRTFEVYQFAHAHKDRMCATRGSTGDMAIPYTQRLIDKHPQTGAALKTSMRYWQINTKYFKDKVYNLFKGEQGRPDRWHLFDDVPPEYITQFGNEHKVIKRDTRGQQKEEWIPKTNPSNNHYWDCEVLATAAADIKRVWALKPHDVIPAPPIPKTPPSAKPGGWIGDKGAGWWNNRRR